MAHFDAALFLLLTAAGTWLFAAFAGRHLGTNVDFSLHRGYRMLVVPPAICMFVYFAALCTDRLLRPRPSLTLMPDGITIDPFFGSGRHIGWDKISDISVFDWRQSLAVRVQVLGIGLREPNRFVQQLGLLGRLEAGYSARMFGYHLYFRRAMVSEPLETVRETMQGFLDKCRQPET